MAELRRVDLGVDKVIEASLFEASERRRRVALFAERVVRAIEERRVTTDLAGFNPAPSGVPVVGWKFRVRDNDEGSFQAGAIGSVGEFYADQYNDQRSSDGFNTGFLAGAMAVARGLVDPAQFLPSDPHSSVEPATPER